VLGYSFHPLAECDVTEAALYSERCTPGLGAQFRANLSQAIILLRQYPEIAPVLRGNLRCKSLLRFKYNLIYAIEDSEIRILVVSSQRRRPDYWVDVVRTRAGESSGA
jgi:plasmid stabilization system protein ParE